MCVGGGGGVEGEHKRVKVGTGQYPLCVCGGGGGLKGSIRGWRDSTVSSESVCVCVAGGGGGGGVYNR